MSGRSIATIDKPEFINITPCNPLISQCEIKVMYVGGNRNHSYITKEVATEMANTLPGCPIVGYYKPEKGDFADHGEQVVIDDEGIKFNVLTRPYGFVAPDAKVWFQKFEDTDEFGNTVTREYLMTTGYLWTGQYEEAKQVLENGKPHSMELDDETLDGYWSKDNKSGLEFFIINDAIFSKLCILGDDVEPCFEGSSVTKPEVSTSFSKVDDKFKQTLYTMMQELTFALKGGQQEMNDNQLETPVVEPEVTPTEPVSGEFVKEPDKTNKDDTNKNQDTSDDSAKQTPDDTKKDDAKDDTSKAGDKKPAEGGDAQDQPKDDGANSDDKKKKENYALLESQYKDLESKYSALSESYKELVEFKNQIENEKKDNLIARFYMLSDEDKKDVIENKAKYSLDDIEAKLSIICVRKRVNFDLDDEKESKEKEPVTYQLDNNDSTPAWIKALENTQRSRNN